MLPMIRNGGNVRVQFGSSCARLEEARARQPNIKSAANRGSMSARLFLDLWQAGAPDVAVKQPLPADALPDHTVLSAVSDRAFLGLHHIRANFVRQVTGRIDFRCRELESRDPRVEDRLPQLLERGTS